MRDDRRVVRIVYETHSITEDNEAGIATGWLPGRLSAEGRRGAAELGVRRANDGVDIVFTSDLGRAVETAEIAFGGTAIPVRTDERLRETNYGEMNGAPVARMEGHRVDWLDRPFPSGETIRDAVDRLDEFLRDVTPELAGRRILVIAHSAQRWGFEHLVNGTPLEDLVDTDFDWQEGWEYSYG